MSDIKFIPISRLTTPVKAPNDIQFDSSNTLVMVSGKSYVAQAVAKALLSTYGQSSFVTEYWSTIDAQKFSDLTDTRAQQTLSDTILYAIAFLNGIEASTLNSELIKSIDDIKIVPNAAGQGTTVTVSLTLKDGTSLTTNIANR